MAINPIDFLKLSDFFTAVFGGNQLLGEVFASLLVAGVFILLCFFLRSQIVVVLIVGILVLVPLTAIGWIPTYTWVILGIYVATQVARNWKEIF